MPQPPPPNPLPTRPLKLTIEPVTSLNDDISILATIFEEALRPDSFSVLLGHLGESVYDGALAATSSAVQDVNQFVFKATVEVDAESVEEDGQSFVGNFGDGTVDGERKKLIIVGLCHWFVGYIETPKVDPLAVREGDDEDPKPVAEIPVNPFQAGFLKHRREVLNTYVRMIQDKKHVYLRRVAVLPSYQGYGIGSKMLQWGVDLADREGLVAYLNARPAGISLYQKFGWEVIGEVPFELPGIEVSPVVQMLRMPRQPKGRKESDGVIRHFPQTP